MTGSSGAPLIDAASRRAVAVLTGGFATCNPSQGAADFYGRLSSAVRSPQVHHMKQVPCPLRSGEVTPGLITDRLPTTL